MEKRKFTDKKRKITRDVNLYSAAILRVNCLYMRFK